MPRESLRDDGTGPVSVVIQRTVLPGREAEFEARLQEFFARAAREPGVCDAQLIRPFAGSASRQYGILRSFRSAEDMRRFYESDACHRWVAAVAAVFGKLPPLAGLLLVNVLVVTMLTWLLMPVFSRIAAPWLQAEPR